MEREGSTVRCFHLPPSVIRDTVYMLCHKKTPSFSGRKWVEPTFGCFLSAAASVSLCREDEGGTQEKLNKMTGEACSCLGWCVLYMYLYTTQPWLEGSCCFIFYSVLPAGGVLTGNRGNLSFTWRSFWLLRKCIYAIEWEISHSLVVTPAESNIPSICPKGCLSKEVLIFS